MLDILYLYSYYYISVMTAAVEAFHGNVNLLTIRQPSITVMSIQDIKERFLKKQN